MNTIPYETIVEVWERQCALGEEECAALVKQFFQEQPALGIYLAANDGQPGEEDERHDSQLIPLATTVWEAMTRVNGKRLKAATPKKIDRAEAANIRVLEKLEDASEFEWNDTVTSLFTGYRQQPVLGFCIEILMAGDAEEPELAPDSIGTDMIWLKTMIDCLDS